jgi:hypothetical protein
VGKRRSLGPRFCLVVRRTENNFDLKILFMEIPILFPEPPGGIRSNASETVPV